MPWQNQSGGPWGSGGSSGGQGGGQGGGPWGSGGGNDNGGDRGGGDKGSSNGGWRPSGNNKPDLEAMLRKGQQRMRGLFSGGGGAKGIVLLLVVAAAIWAATGFYRVEPGEQGLVLRFGQWTNQADPKLAGLHWHLPYPIETVEILNVEQERRTTVGLATEDVNTRTRTTENFVLTRDQNIVRIDFTVIWKIKDPGAYVFNIRDQEATILAVSESAMREIVGRTDIQQVFSQSDSKLVTDTKDLIQSILDEYKSGILVTAVTVLPPRPPEAVADAFEDVQRAGQDKDKQINLAEAYRNKVVPEARGDAARAIQEAEAYKEQVVKIAQGEAARFLSVYGEYVKAPEITRRRIYIETLQAVLAKTAKLIIDPSLQGVVPYLPINELKPPSAAQPVQ